MESTLVACAKMPAWDDALMRALSQASAPTGPTNGVVIGVEDDAGDIYRLVRTSGVYETVRLFESARQLGFSITAGRSDRGTSAHRVLRRSRHTGA
jgi:hypothetical protein